MSDPSLELQKMLVAVLKALAMTEVGNRIYDKVPAAAAYPYVSLGDCQVLPDKAGCIDGSEVFLQIDAWSQAVNYGESKSIAKQIVARLDDAEDLNVDGYDVIVFELQGVQHLRDPDGLTRHAAITFRTLVQPSS